MQCHLSFSKQEKRKMSLFFSLFYGREIEARQTKAFDQDLRRNKLIKMGVAGHCPIQTCRRSKYKNCGVIQIK